MPTTTPAAAFRLTEIARYAGAVACRSKRGGDVLYVDATDFDAPTSESETWDEWSARVDWLDEVDCPELATLAAAAHR